MSLTALDFKLGFRMLVKYPGLTVVGGLAMAFAIWVGAVTFQLVTLITNPALPLPGGDRIVQIRSWDVAAGRAEPRVLHDFMVWRSSLASVTDLGAWRDITPNLLSPDGEARGVAGAEITASAFRIAPAPPLMGRVLSPADEQAGAPPVVVLGYEVWRTRFAGDPGVVGRSVRLGDSYATVVGVMPEGFAFPVSHELWTPLRPALLDQAPRAGPGISVFGRLAPGVTLDAAQTELTLLGRRAAALLPETHRHLEPRVTPYAEQFFEPTDLRILFSINVFAIMLLVLICSNVALLMFARAATRENELVVRSALGASRRRIITQLFAEALVLGGVAAAVGLAAAGFALDRWGKPYLELNLGRLPFWYDVSLSPATMLYAVGLTLLGAVVAGVVPAVKATHRLGLRLREGSAGGGGLKFGGVWTAVVITQVAATVAFPAVVYVQQRELRRIRSFDVGFPAEQYLGARLEMDLADVTVADTGAERAAGRRRFGAALETLRRRVTAEPGGAGVTFVDQLPRLFHRERRVELDDASPAGGQAPEVSIASIDPSYFDVLESPILAGRAFHSGLVAAESRVVIVDQGFVEKVLKGRSAVGRRVRFEPRDGPSPAEAQGPWYEIVGVVKDLGLGYVTHHGRTAGVYLPADLSGGGPLYMVVHAQGDPMALGPRIRALTTAVDPTLRVAELARTDQVTDGVQWILRLWIRTTVVLTATALLLSLAGIYAVLSFTVARRTREIGVRVALGASRRRVVAAIFRRPLTHVGLGVLAGGILVGAGAVALTGSGLSPGQVGLLVAYAGVMLAVCLLACIVPTRRALSVEPTVALRQE
jgi:predicted permease